MSRNNDIKKMTQSEEKRRQQQTTYASKLDELIKEQRYIVDKAMEKLTSGKHMMMLIHGHHDTENTKFVALEITTLAQINYNLQTKFVAYIDVVVAEGCGSTMHDYLDIGYDAPTWPTKFSS